MQLDLNQSLNTSLRQEQTLAPQQLQSLEILQASSLELEQRVLHEISLNPLLELDSPGAEILESDFTRNDARTNEELQTDLTAAAIEKDENLADALQEDTRDSYLDNYVSDLFHAHPDAEAEEKRRHFFDSLTCEPAPLDQLEPQIREAAAENEELAETAFQIAGNLDDDGYLRLNIAELQELTGKSEALIQQAITLLQSLDPAGLAATSLRECLLLQLERNREKGSIAWDIVDRHLEDLARNRLPLIAKAVDADLDEVQEAITRIQQLSPRPGRQLIAHSAPVISPDAFIEKNAQGQWTVRLNDEIIPRVVLNEEYLEKLTDPDTPAETRHYIRNCQYSANQLIRAIDQRQSTLAKITDALILLQKEFLEVGTEKLKPLIMSEVAEIIGVHDATVSRAIANKYVQTPQGLFPYKFFFNTGYSSSSSGEELTSRGIKQRIIALINKEDPQKPLSDQTISLRLKEQGLDVARRTVAKYREEENIPAASLRKIHQA